MGERQRRNFIRQNYDPDNPSYQHAPQTAGEVVNSYIDKKISTGLSKTNKAYVMWCKAAGKRAASHTMAVWINEKKKPVELVVYLDNNSLIVDYTTNAELYIDRLNYIGFPVSGLKFRLSNKVSKKSHKDAFKNSELELPELSYDEIQQIEEECKNLPLSIKKNAFKAMEMSLRRQKLQTTENNKTDA